MLIILETSVWAETQIRREAIIFTWQVFPTVKSAGGSTVLSIYITQPVKGFKELLLTTLITVLRSEWTE